MPLPTPSSRAAARNAFLVFATVGFLVASLRAAAPAMPPFRIGLNDGFIGNRTLSLPDELALFQQVGAAGLRHLGDGDVNWRTVQQPNGLFTADDTDTVVGSDLGFGFVPTFYGSASQNYYVPPGAPATSGWSEAEFGAQTTTYLQTVVTRYQAATHYWEIGNEMNTKTTPPAGFSAADYAAFLVFNRTAIRAADPGAQVLIAGTLGNYGYPFSGAYDWLRDVLDAGGAAGFDVFNFHDYKSWWALPAHYDEFRAILDDHGLQAMPIWVTETAQASAISSANLNPAYASVDGQAADVWRRFCVLFGKGAQIVFWHSFWANPDDTSGFHDTGLVTSATGVRKKAWHAYRLLAGKLEGFASAALLATGVAVDDNVDGGTGIRVVRFPFADGTRRWVAWSPDHQNATLADLTGIASATVTTVRGLTRLQFTAGSDSQGGLLPAQPNAAVLLQDGVDVTRQIAANP
ncbi:MAG TPA: hypothetical protein VHE13_01110 [Opitutus sp.]|nr:hypothetical protein [Opitutus sp.]